MVDLSRTFGGRSAQIKTNPNGIDLVDDNGRVAQAYGNIAATVSKVALKFNQELKQEEAMNYGATNGREYSLNLQTRFNQMKTEYGPDKMDQMQADFKAYSDELRNSYMENAPHSDAKNSFFRQASSADMSLQSKLIGHSNQVKVDQQVNSLNKSADLLKNSLILEPSSDIAVREFDDLQTQITQSKSLSNIEKSKLINQERDRIGSAVMLGFERKGLTKQGRDFLKGGNSFGTSMTPEQRRMWEDRMDAKDKLLQSEDTSILSKEIQFSVASVTKDKADPKQLQQLTGKVANSRMTQIDKDVAYEKLGSALLTRTITDSIALIPPSARTDDKMKGLINDSANTFKIQNKFLANAMKADITNEVKKAAEEMQKQVTKDPVNYFTKHDDILKDLSTAANAGDPDAFYSMQTKLDAYYDQWDIPEHKRKYFTNEMNENYSKDIKNFIDGGNHKAAVKVFNDIRNMVGDSRKDAVLQDMGLSKYSVVGEAVDERAMLTVMSNMSPENSALIKKDYEKLNTDSADRKEILAKVDAEMSASPMYMALQRQAGGSPQVIAYAASVKNHVMTEYQRLRGQKGFDDKEAKEAAWGLFGGDKHIARSGESFVKVPENVDKTKVSDWMNYTGDNWDKLHTEFNIGTDNLVPISDQIATLKENGVWATNAQGTGVSLYQRVGRNLLRVTDKKGKQISKSFDEIESSNLKGGMTVTDKIKNVFSSLSRSGVNSGI